MLSRGPGGRDAAIATGASEFHEHFTPSSSLDKAPDGTFVAARIGYAELHTLEGLLDGYREETKRASRGRAEEGYR